MAIGECVGFIGLSLIPVNVDALGHHISAIFAFANLLGWEFASLTISWQHSGLGINLYRSVVLAIQVFGMACVGGSDSMASERVRITVSALGEHIFVGGMPFFYMPYFKEFSAVVPSLTILE
jgi:hypothetical protein